MERLLSGVKTIELRRTRPNAIPGQRVLLYATSPTRALVGSAVIDSIATDRPARMWPTVAKRAAVSRDEYFGYFEGAAVAVAIAVRDVRQFRASIPLSEMRRRWPWLRPPQSFRFVMFAGLLDDTITIARRERGSSWAGRRSRDRAGAIRSRN